MKTMTDLCIVYCTTDSRQNAETIANQLLTQHLAACVQIIPGMTSVYRWDNQVMQDQEFQILIKTHQHKLAEAEQLVTALHNYDVPQWIAVPACAAREAYDSWVEQELNIQKEEVIR